MHLKLPRKKSFIQKLKYENNLRTYLDGRKHILPYEN